MFFLIVLCITLPIWGSYKDVPVPIAHFSNVQKCTTSKPYVEIASKQNDIVYDQRSKSLNSSFNRMENYSAYKQYHEIEWGNGKALDVIPLYRNNPILNQHWNEGQSLYLYSSEKKLASELNPYLSDNPVQLLVNVPIQKNLCDVATLNAIESIKTNFKTLLESNNSFSTVKAIHELLHSSINNTSYNQQWIPIKEKLSLVACAPDATIKVDLSSNDRQLITQICADFCKTISGSPAEWYDTLLSINTDNFKSTIVNDINSRTSILNTIKTEGGIGQAYQCAKSSSQQIINGIKNLQRGCTPKTFLKKVQANEVNQKLGHLIKLAENNKSNEAADYLKNSESLLPYNRIISGLKKNKTESLASENNLNAKQAIAVNDQDSLIAQASSPQATIAEQNLVKNELTINGLPKIEESDNKIPQWDYSYNAPVIARFVNLSKHQKKYNYHIDSSLRNEITNLIEQNFNDCKAQLDKYEQVAPLVLSENNKQAEFIVTRREEALNFIKEHGSIVYEQNYELSLESKWLLNQKKENQRVLEYCIGNAIQQVVHTEVVELFNKVSELSFKKTASDYDKTLHSKIADYLLHTAKVNLEGHASKALSLADFCWSLFEYGQTVSKYVGHSLEHCFNQVAYSAQNVAHKLYVVTENIVFSDTARVINPLGSSIAHTLKQTIQILSDYESKASYQDLKVHNKNVLIDDCLNRLLSEIPSTFITELYNNEKLAAECAWLAVREGSELGSEIAKNPEQFVLNATEGFIKPFVYTADILLDLADIVLQDDLEKCAAKLNSLCNRVGTDGINLAKTMIALAELPVQEKAKLIGRMVTEGLLIDQGLGVIFNATSPAIQVALARAENILRELKEVNAVAQTAEGFAVESKIPAQFMEAERITNSIGKLVVTNQQLEEHINAVLKNLKTVSEYLTNFEMESIINVEKVTDGARLFKEVNSFWNKDGPLYKILKTATKTLDGNDLNTARGAIYELEKALNLESKGEKVVYFGRKLPGNKTCEFDIETLSKLIECKDRYWQNITAKKMQTMKSRFIEQKKNASAYGKTFEVHSKQPIPEHWQKWFYDNGISFIEG
ncbi:MAG: hypothetical protein ACOYT8_00580 [Candidatus Dependentiae bacterium]